MPRSRQGDDYGVDDEAAGRVCATRVHVAGIASLQKCLLTLTILMLVV